MLNRLEELVNKLQRHKHPVYGPAPLLAQPAWLEKEYVEVVDELVIPFRLRTIRVRSAHQAAKVIKEIRTRAVVQVYTALFSLALEALRHRGEVGKGSLESC